MKSYISLLLFFILLTPCIQAQQINAGIGYHGENASYPGVVLELEHEKFQSEKFSTPTSLNLGYYLHPRNHGALFLDVQHGFRRYSEGRFYFEQKIGMGVMFSFYPEDVWHVDENGSVAKVSKWANPDIMPSLTLGAGYRFGKDTVKPKYLWVRPKVFWQFPFNNLALPHIALQAGVTKKLK